uniref:EamA family transporter n=1 Tax=uncultured Tateyamaria sp. TaxID=455651 RepID=UPI0026016C8A
LHLLLLLLEIREYPPHLPRWLRQSLLPPLQLKGGVLGGVASVLSFSAALYAFTLTDAAIVTALRETSVVWAALMGAIWLKEGFGRRRIIAALVLAAGLLLMQLSA